ncbi:hypothetical protein MTP99_012298 [Tenebrio molitor]|jgi:hypothetical protein|nr:hypothetical protein MTP99_012298 [Tenebrio molitor]CAH1370768.1 unnamed protein product [Tenebrio molitor]
MKLFINFIVVLILVESLVSKEIACHSKEFICYDQTRFHQCVQIGNNRRIVMGRIQNCPKGLVCKNNADFECEDPDNILLT